MKSPDTTHTITLKDGRTLGYAEFGDPAGKPVFYFSGSTVSGLIARTIHAAAAQAGARIIAADRPGIGLSDYMPHRTLQDWPNDVCELAGTLGIDRFAVMSESGGSLYAAVCALRIPDRLTAVAIVAGPSPFDAPGVLQGMPAPSRTTLLMVQKAPSWLWRLLYAPVSVMARRSPDRLRPQLLQSARGMPEPDRAVFTAPEYQAALLEAFCAAFRQGPRGPVLDLKLCAQSWGEWLPDIPIEVQLWHGELDQNAPIAMVRYMRQAIPRSRAMFYPDEGHVSIMHNHCREILQSLCVV